MKILNKFLLRCIFFSTLFFCFATFALFAEEAVTDEEEESEVSTADFPTLDVFLPDGFSKEFSGDTNTNKPNNDKQEHNNRSSLVPQERIVPSNDYIYDQGINKDKHINDYNTVAERLSMYKDKDYLDYLYYGKSDFGSISDIRVVEVDAQTFQLVIKLDKAFLANVRTINFPFRLIIDIPMPYKMNVEPDVIKKNVPISYITSFRIGKISKTTFRIVATLSTSYGVMSSLIQPNQDGTYDFVITLVKGTATDRVWLSNNLSFVKDKDSTEYLTKISYNNSTNEILNRYLSVVDPLIKTYLSKINYQKPESPFPNRKITVVLDPGHGGKDPGAISKDGTITEKDLVLKIAQSVSKKLLNNLDINVILTRNGDYYVPLRDRVLWSQYYNANLMVSIHGDNSQASNGLTASGMSLYTLSDTASDDQAQQIANNSNDSDIIAGVSSSEVDEDVTKILVRLSQRMKVNDSLLFARTILSKAVGNIKVMDNPLRSAGFAVLKTPNIPSVLLEVGFLSNPGDVALLRTNLYIQRISDIIATGIEQYLWDTNALLKVPQSVVDKKEEYEIQLQNKKLIEEGQSLIDKAMKQVYEEQERLPVKQKQSKQAVSNLYAEKQQQNSLLASTTK